MRTSHLFLTIVLLLPVAAEESARDLADASLASLRQVNEENGGPHLSQAVSHLENALAVFVDPDHVASSQAMDDLRQAIRSCVAAARKAIGREDEALFLQLRGISETLAVAARRLADVRTVDLREPFLLIDVRAAQAIQGLTDEVQAEIARGDLLAAEQEPSFQDVEWRRWDDAVSRYGSAWRMANGEGVDGEGGTTVHLSLAMASFQDAPDPFVPDGDGQDDLSVLTISYATDGGDAGARVRTVWTIATSAAWSTVVVEESEVPVGEGRTAWTVSVAWEGKTSAGCDVVAGTYGYSLTAVLLLPGGEEVPLDGSVAGETTLDRPPARGDEIVLGLGAYPVSGGWAAAASDFSRAYAPRGWLRRPQAAYNFANGETRPALGDTDGDGLDEVFLAAGTWTADGGWIAVLDDAVGAYQLIRWVRVDWPAYNAVDGQIWPAAGDIDGDGLAEFVAGFGSFTASGGWVALFDDAAHDCSPLGWVRVPWSMYNAENGETRPALGDLDGDGVAEMVVGLGRYPRSGGWLAVLHDLTGSDHSPSWVRYNYPAYNAANGETWPACGDLDGDSGDEILVGSGRYEADGGWSVVFDDAGHASVPLAWVRFPWSDYNALNGEVRAACGDTDGDDVDEIVLGVGASSISAGYCMVRPLSKPCPRWVRVQWSSYGSSCGATRPAVGDLE